MASDYCKCPLAISCIRLADRHPSGLEEMLDIVGVTPLDLQRPRRLLRFALEGLEEDI